MIYAKIAAIVMVSPLFGLGIRGCDENVFNNLPNKYIIGQCIRNKELVTKSKYIGYFKLVIDKTESSYITCQGQYRGMVSGRWYGCNLQPATNLLNTMYTQVECPNWKIDDDAYGDYLK